MKIVALAAAFLVASGPAFAQEPVKGNFKSQSVSVDLGGAIAFRGTSSFNQTEPAIIVAVSNRRLVPTLGDFLDRRRALDTLVKSDDTALVYFELRR